DRVLPPEARDEVAAGVADGRRPELAHQIDHIQAEAVLVRGRVARLVDAVVDASAEVLDERAEDATVDRGDHGLTADGDARTGHGRPLWPPEKTSSSPRWINGDRCVTTL